MGAFDALDISGSGLSAQRARMERSASNIANAQTTRTEAGGPYRRKTVVFAESLQRASLGQPTRPAGVRVDATVEDTTPFPRVYQPSHPDADAQGFLLLPNVDTVKEMADLSMASRAYEADIAAFSATKMMLLKALDIGK